MLDSFFVAPVAKIPSGCEHLFANLNYFFPFHIKQENKNKWYYMFTLKICFMNDISHDLKLMNNYVS